MKKQQSGFTLIELMIVVAIIGILAAIAVPQYQNFMARSQAAESVVLLDGARTTVEDAVMDTGTFLADKATLISYGVKITGTYGAIMGVSAHATDTGTVTYKMNGSVNKNIQGKKVEISRTGGESSKWVCKTEMPAKYAPKGCTASQTVADGA